VTKELSNRDKARLAAWLVVIEFCLSAIRDELESPVGSVVDDIDGLNEDLTTVYGAVGLLRVRLGIE